MEASGIERLVMTRNPEVSRCYRIDIGKWRDLNMKLNSSEALTLEGNEPGLLYVVPVFKNAYYRYVLCGQNRFVLVFHTNEKKLHILNRVPSLEYNIQSEINYWVDGLIVVAT